MIWIFLCTTARICANRTERGSSFSLNSGNFEVGRHRATWKGGKREEGGGWGWSWWVERESGGNETDHPFATNPAGRCA